jgi:3-methylfumaryl-CoA hydratase
MSSDVAVRRSAAAPLDAEVTKRYTLNSTTLFRYSALTFNGHRIHYDADYCREVEGYPDLVIHGPLIATLLLDLCVRIGRPLHTFSYRAKSPLFLPHVFSVNARLDGSSTRLWASNHEGGLAMEAEATAG